VRVSRRLIVIGAGGHAKVVLDMAVTCGWPVLGLTDPDPLKTGSSVLDHKVLGGDEQVEQHGYGEVMLAMGIGGLPLRMERFESFRQAGFSFASLVHPSAVVATSVRLADGVQVMANATIQPDVTLGTNCVVNTAASIDHDCVIADHVFVAPGAVLAGSVRVGIGAMIGTGAVLLPGVGVGAHAVIGAGAVVTCDVDNGARVVGVPARQIGSPN
jgi:sugar O-acyltransferase (sialic acid O-acetyltransferase NeuD family)